LPVFLSGALCRTANERHLFCTTRLINPLQARLSCNTLVNFNMWSFSGVLFSGLVLTTIAGKITTPGKRTQLECRPEFMEFPRCLPRLTADYSCILNRQKTADEDASPKQLQYRVHAGCWRKWCRFQDVMRESEAGLVVVTIWMLIGQEL